MAQLNVTLPAGVIEEAVESAKNEALARFERMHRNQEKVEVAVFESGLGLQLMEALNIPRDIKVHELTVKCLPDTFPIVELICMVDPEQSECVAQTIADACSKNTGVVAGDCIELPK